MAKGEIANIDAELCKGCGLCVAFCPKGALAVSEQPNSRGLFPAVMADPQACTGCEICAVVCPDCAVSFLAPSSKEDVR